MQTFTIAQFLKYKKRLVGEISKNTKEIEKYNSRNVKTVVEVDVRKKFDYRQKLIKHLVDLKSVLFMANQPIQKLIFEAAEIKGTIAMLAKLPTTHGVQPATHVGYESHTFEAVVRKSEVEEQTKQLTKHLDKIQEELDAFNHTRKVDIPDAPVE